MADTDSDVKRNWVRCVADFVDAHPRSGWYIGAWMFLVSTQAALGWMELLITLLN